MFITSSNTAFNNKVFNPSTMDAMDEIHPSMTRLYAAANMPKGKKGQALLAKAMNTSSQKINNWESLKRGISLAGALHAQKLFRCDANWLLEGDNLYGQDAGNKPISIVEARETTAPFGWPFKTIKPHQWELLLPEEVAHVESGIALLVKDREDQKKITPAPRNGTDH